MFFFIVGDILFSNLIYKKEVQGNCYKYTEYFHYLKKNCYAKEKWIKKSKSYNVYTDENGHRFGGDKKEYSAKKPVETIIGGIVLKEVLIHSSKHA